MSKKNTEVMNAKDIDVDVTYEGENLDSDFISFKDMKKKSKKNADVHHQSKAEKKAAKKAAKAVEAQEAKAAIETKDDSKLNALKTEIAETTGVLDATIFKLTSSAKNKEYADTLIEYVKAMKALEHDVFLVTNDVSYLEAVMRIDINNERAAENIDKLSGLVPVDIDKEVVRRVTSKLSDATKNLFAKIRYIPGITLKERIERLTEIAMNGPMNEPRKDVVVKEETVSTPAPVPVARSYTASPLTKYLNRMSEVFAF